MPVINYKGLTVKNRFKLNKEKIVLDKADDFLFVLKQQTKRGANTLAKGNTLENDFEFEETLESAERVLPYFPYQDDGLNLEMIQYDFPELTVEEIEEKIELIDEYYARSLNTTIARDINEPGFIDSYEDEVIRFYNPPVNNNPPRIPKHTSEANTGESKEDCIFRLGGIEGNDFRQLYSIFFSERGAKSSSKFYYGSLNSNNTKRDAYRHTVWNALLSRNYWTLSSKLKRYNFAKKIADLNERCASNSVGTLYMDYHNNEIGRQLYQTHTTFKKFLWMKVGLKQPTLDELKEYAYDLIESKAIFIDMFSFLPNIEKEQQEKAYLKIISTNSATPVYLSKALNADSYYGN